MSNINIKRAVENIRAHTSIYTPVVEIIVNAIQAIDECPDVRGRIRIKVLREDQLELQEGLPAISGFTIHDNGIGFTDTHRLSFDTLYTDHRIAEGGKGFGRFICLKYFDDLYVDSVFADGSRFLTRTFSMGENQDIIVDEQVRPTDETASRTLVTLSGLKGGRNFEKKLATIARNLVERLLPYFITDGYECPDIVLAEQDGSGAIRLNDFVSNEVSAFIQEVTDHSGHFALTAHDASEDFTVRLFRIYSPRHQKSRISLVAHKREVTGSALERYIPEFADDFYDGVENGLHEAVDGRNYIIKAYTFGSYLDRHVSLERGTFEFHMENELILGISQAQIERQAADIAELAVGYEIGLRKNRKRERIQSYVDQEAPWHKDIVRNIDLSDLPHRPTKQQIEARLQQEKLAQELEIKGDVERILSEESLADIEDNVVEIVSKISGTSKNDLIHYIALRRKLLDILRKSLELNPSGRYSPEAVVHDIVFPRRGDTDVTPFHDHNLWIIDERLNFTDYVSSDRPLHGPQSNRPDLLVYDNRVLFRGDNEASNPITIFEFKRPQRDDFVDPSSSEDPIQQIVRYTNNIRAGKYKTPEGRKILVTDNTPFYGYVVCDLTPKIESWLQLEKDFRPMPDGLGWFQWMGNINLYIELISWDKVLKDAQMRNRIFFHKLGI